MYELSNGPLTALQIQNCFVPHNKNVKYTPKEYTWGPLKIPNATEAVNFFQGIKTIGGHGDPTLKEGLAVHMYAANVSMINEAFCNNDGDMLVIPQIGRLDIQTEMGRMMVRPGEIAVLQAGIRFKVDLPDGRAHGYIQEIYGSHYHLPELGPIGSTGMADPRDFDHPVASFEIDDSKWRIVHKLVGELYVYEQDWTPFDVVGWHGK